jgi:hypothetical protein
LVNDIYQNAGPMAGIYSALKATKTKSALVLSCDMPFVKSSLLEQLCAHEHRIAVVPKHKHFIEPLCALYSKEILPFMKEALEQGNRALHKLLDQVKTKHLEIPDQENSQIPWYTNFNTLSDINKLEGNKRKNILIVSGSTKKVGKTTLVCTILKQLGNKENIVAIKISPHFHDVTTKQILLSNSKQYHIYRETERDPIADSSRYLNAGASNSYYIQAKDEAVNTAFNELVRTENLHESLCIVESASLASYLIPAVHMFVGDTKIKNEKHNFTTTLDEIGVTNFSSLLVISDCEWKIKAGC